MRAKSVGGRMDMNSGVRIIFHKRLIGLRTKIGLRIDRFDLILKFIDSIYW